MTFSSAYNYLMSLANLPRQQYMRAGSACDIYMKRLQFLLDILNNPEKQIPHYIHVTGTSGKGSITAYLHNILHAAGRPVGSTYSPHVSSILERWRIGDRNMTEHEFVTIIEQLKPALDTYIRTSPYEVPSFFEIMEAIGFLWFAKKHVEWVVLEVGCGGRYDSSNIIPHKDIAIISNIGLDHVGIIGNTKEEIAYEKAGIIGKQTPTFSMEAVPSIQSVMSQEAKKQDAPITFVQPGQGSIIDDSLTSTTFEYDDHTYTIQLSGDHQVNNAILCIEVAQSLNISTDTIQKGLAATENMIRVEVVSEDPLMIIDGAHNEDKMKATVATIRHHLPDTAVHLLVGFTDGKDHKTMIETLAQLNIASIAVTRFTNNPFRKAAHPKAIASLLKKIGISAPMELFLDPADAIAWSKGQQQANELLLVTGSIFLAGDIRDIV